MATLVKTSTMKNLSIILTLLLSSFNTFAQTKLNPQLQKEIAAMFKEDQKWRKESDKIMKGEKSAYSEAAIDKNWAKADALNQKKAKVIINKYGFPGFDLVGEDGSNNFWAIVQHCDDDVKFQERVLFLLDKQVKRHNASASNYALLKDRVLINTSKKQLYGTQVRYNPATKTAKPLPIADSANVDVRRKAVGLSTLNEYLKLFDRN